MNQLFLELCLFGLFLGRDSHFLTIDISSKILDKVRKCCVALITYLVAHCLESHVCHSFDIACYWLSEIFPKHCFFKFCKKSLLFLKNAWLIHNISLGCRLEVKLFLRLVFIIRLVKLLKAYINTIFIIWVIFLVLCNRGVSKELKFKILRIFCFQPRLTKKRFIIRRIIIVPRIVKCIFTWGANIRCQYIHYNYILGIFNACLSSFFLATILILLLLLLLLLKSTPKIT